MSAWRCCCCPAQGEATNPEHALRDHWARDCPTSAEEPGDG